MKCIICYQKTLMLDLTLVFTNFVVNAYLIGLKLIVYLIIILVMLNALFVELFLKKSIRKIKIKKKEEKNFL